MPAAHVYKLGDAEITRVQDCTIETFEPAQLLPDWQHGDAPLLHAMPGSMTPDGRHLRLSIHSWVVRHHGRTILIDTGVGNGKPRPFAPWFDRLETPYLARLHAAGVAPQDVDYVLHTHLHVDHVGWNTRWDGDRWAPTFPNARHLFSAKEYAYFTDPANLTPRNRTSFQVQADSVTPIVEAGMAERIVVDGSEIIPGFRFFSTPGHSADHASIVLESAGARAIFAGDVLHHPVQISRPDLLSIFDPERDVTLRSRRWALDFAADHGAAMFSSHFPESSVGKVTRKHGGYSWNYL